MRLFLGIDLPEQLKAKINAYIEPLKMSEKGWEQSHDFHLTLLFIGEIKEEELRNIKRKLEHIKFSPFTLKSHRIEFFSRRILYMSFEDSENLLKLKKQIDEYFPEYLRFGDKKFLPHITLKRWQRYEFNQLAEGIQKLESQQFSLEVLKLYLFKSEKNELGQKYHVMGTNLTFSDR